jgi:hypothetical protein
MFKSIANYLLKVVSSIYLNLYITLSLSLSLSLLPPVPSVLALRSVPLTILIEEQKRTSNS